MLHRNNSTNERGSNEDDSGAHAGFVDLSSILGRLQHLDIVQVHSRNFQPLCSKMQMMTLFCSAGSLRGLAWELDHNDHSLKVTSKKHSKKIKFFF